MTCQLGGSVQTRVAEEREIAQTQIRTMLDEQRRILTAECSEKVLHHELLAAHAEQDRKILREELRQQQEFREARQQDLIRHLELQKFQNSESQKTIMNLSGRLQELQNEVNLMNDSKDFMDAESTCSGNLHVTSPPGWPGGWGPQGMSRTGGGGLVRVPNLRVCQHLWTGGGTRRGGRMNQHPAVVPSSRRGKNLQSVAKEEEPGCPKRVSGRHVVRGRQSSPIPAQQPAVYRWQ